MQKTGDFYGDAVERLATRMEQSQDKPTDLADASRIAAAEQFGTRRPFTLDSTCLLGSLGGSGHGVLREGATAPQEARKNTCGAAASGWHWGAPRAPRPRRWGKNAFAIPIHLVLALCDKCVYNLFTVRR